MIIQAILILLLSGSFWGTMSVTAQELDTTREKLLSVANAVLKNATYQFVDPQSGQRFESLAKVPTTQRVQPESPYNDWRYWNGVLNLAMIRLATVLEQPSYREFTRKNIAFCFDSYPYFEARYNQESKWNYPFSQFFILEELDDCGAMGASVIEVFRWDPQERYRQYLERAADHILTKQSRLPDGTLVRTFPERWTIWADDLYMGVSFLARWGELTGGDRPFDDATQQVINFHKYLFAEAKGLMYHCWYSDNETPGVAFWGRANGWAVLAQVDLLDRLPENHPQRQILLILLRRHLLGIAQYQSGEGLWHQLLDKEDSFLETSCSAMITYAVARAVNQGYLEARYTSVAQRGWEGVMTKIRPDGQIEGVCAGTGVADNLVHYYHRPTPLNDAHSIGAVLLAGAEILRLQNQIK